MKNFRTSLVGSGFGTRFQKLVRHDAVRLLSDYYDQAMKMPDDVTLLWCDNIWGDIRRLPTAAERKRSGGAGFYYHFDNVGGPRSYKWINSG